MKSSSQSHKSNCPLKIKAVDGQRPRQSNKSVVSPLKPTEPTSKM